MHKLKLWAFNTNSPIISRMWGMALKQQTQAKHSSMTFSLSTNSDYLLCRHLKGSAWTEMRGQIQEQLPATACSSFTLHCKQQTDALPLPRSCAAANRVSSSKPSCHTRAAETFACEHVCVNLPTLWVLSQICWGTRLWSLVCSLCRL